MSTQCKAFTDRTGATVCNRCGYQWDADDDDDPPKCKPWGVVKQEKKDRKHKEREANKAVGREALKHIREDYLK